VMTRSGGLGFLGEKRLERSRVVFVFLFVFGGPLLPPESHWRAAAAREARNWAIEQNEQSVEIDKNNNNNNK